MRRSLKLLLGLGAAFGSLQAVRVDRTNPPVRGDLDAPPRVREVFRKACYDCHSNETRWPWYSGVAPMSWLLQHDVIEGRRRLNFSEWSDYASDPDTAARKLREVARSLTDGGMAPWYYQALHPEARVASAERVDLGRWAAAEALRISSHQIEGPR